MPSGKSKNLKNLRIWKSWHHTLENSSSYIPPRQLLLWPIPVWEVEHNKATWKTKDSGIQKSVNMKERKFRCMEITKQWRKAPTKSGRLEIQKIAEQSYPEYTFMMIFQSVSWFPTFLRWLSHTLNAKIKGKLGSEMHYFLIVLSCFYLQYMANLTRQRTSRGNSDGNDNGNCKGNYQWLHAVREWVIRLGGTLGRVGGGDNSNRRAQAIEGERERGIFQTRRRMPDFQIIFNTSEECYSIFIIVLVWVSDISKFKQK